MVHDRLLDAAHVDRFKTLILPNIAALSDGQCRQLREYVGRGGGIVATFETSLYDEWGGCLTNFGLADLFGASYDGGMDSRMMNSYLRLENDPATGKRHPILAGWKTPSGSSTASRACTPSPRPTTATRR